MAKPTRKPTRSILFAAGGLGGAVLVLAAATAAGAAGCAATGTAAGGAFAALRTGGGWDRGAGPKAPT